uniref:Hopanoid biosynthesis associated radical SAM protein HpnH n=1 Tax=Candidatus Kentrum sp. TUN TaxID=2126343 RepID=A0A450ZPT4_9GAMM|nr:MAG: hopanoid biosynthesis associated radical SAM protein HpnH [Candidatus Kentron sp. TUN]VFK55000.1 MAG: hopanoid biosynthesis associated radical SAM protein HpnH [Candidatus Kentron sp. TUN]VFK55780.1 MAG: hopanoid biosynthesis associated radical SAM protein HpnH [Candidatus Kentron sp. TUN]
MGIPLIQQYLIGKYLLGKKIRRVKRYPVVLMLEPLFRCNLTCAGCGKINYPDEILNKRLSVEDCLQAVDECNAPVVSIPGGEPLIHKDIQAIVEGIIARKKFVYLCTNALLLKKNLHKFTPSEYLTFSIHLDGKRERHDASVCQSGVFDQVVDAIEVTLSQGFRVTINYTLFQGETAREVAEFLDFVTDLGIEGVTLSPGYSYEYAPQREAFLQRSASERLFREVFRIGKERNRKWRFNQSSLFLDFLAGNRDYQCTPWGTPTVNVFGWQKPCYLLSDNGFASSFKALMEETEWDNYGIGRNPKCTNCMMHCGYEPTAIDDTLIHPIKALRVALRGPRTTEVHG